MATAPMMDPTQAPPEAEPMEAQGGGYEICIKVASDGSMTVGVVQEGQEGPEPAEGFQAVSGVKEALTLALEIYKSNGGAPQSSSPEVQKQFAQGFAGAQ